MTKIQVELQKVYGTDRDIAEAAWTSSTELSIKEIKNDMDVLRVINMLADKKHSVPFESVIFRFWMRLPIAIDRQIMTHRIASHSGMSGRYRTMPDDFLEIPQDVLDILTSKLNQMGDIDYKTEYEQLCYKANNRYQVGIKELKMARDSGRITSDEFKRLREFMRGMLPQHNMTERVTIMNLRSWANFYRLRSKSDAQKEIQDIANSMCDQIMISNACPIAIKALRRNNWQI